MSALFVAALVGMASADVRFLEHARAVSSVCPAFERVALNPTFGTPEENEEYNTYEETVGLWFPFLFLLHNRKRVNSCPASRGAARNKATVRLGRPNSQSPHVTITALIMHFVTSHQHPDHYAGWMLFIGGVESNDGCDDLW